MVAAGSSTIDRALHFTKEQRALKNVNNGKESTVNRALGGSTYPS